MFKHNTSLSFFINWVVFKDCLSYCFITSLCNCVLFFKYILKCNSVNVKYQDISSEWQSVLLCIPLSTISCTNWNNKNHYFTLFWCNYKHSVQHKSIIQSPLKMRLPNYYHKIVYVHQYFQTCSDPSLLQYPWGYGIANTLSPSNGPPLPINPTLSRRACLILCNNSLNVKETRFTVSAGDLGWVAVYLRDVRGQRRPRPWLCADAEHSWLKLKPAHLQTSCQ